VTSGNLRIDWYVSAKSLEPPGSQEHYTEKLVCLDSLPTYYYRPPVPEQLKGRPYFNLEPADHVYLCAQNVRKYHPDFDWVLGEILRRDRKGRLLVVADVQPAITELLMERFQRTIPDVVDRVRVQPRLAEPEYLNLMAVSDVVLDTMHYGGGANTVLDAAAAGTPTVTLPGEFHRGQWCAAVYKTIGMTDCIASSLEQYITQATRLATETDYRKAMCERIRTAEGMLFEQMQPVNELERFVLEQIASLKNS
jgi:predicted O-linked N-acetylglucosamine transferase (SPINDLY family)